MRYAYARILFAILFLLLSLSRVAYAIPVYSFELTPQSGHLALALGDTKGWGYKITNNSSFFLVPASLDSDIVFDGLLISLFDFPVIAPHSILERHYKRGEAGLFEFVWNIDAPSSAVNIGYFSITASFFDNDPLVGGNHVTWADPMLASYSLSIGPARVVPEPPALTLLIPMLLVIFWWGGKINRTVRTIAQCANHKFVG